jgi:flagellar hook-length control protein FliK
MVNTALSYINVQAYGAAANTNQANGSSARTGSTQTDAFSNVLDKTASESQVQTDTMAKGPKDTVPEAKAPEGDLEAADDSVDLGNEDLEIPDDGLDAGDDTLELPQDEIPADEVPVELAALVDTTIQNAQIPEPTVVPEQSAETIIDTAIVTDTAPAPEIEVPDIPVTAEPIADTAKEQVVPILEGNKDIEAPTPQVPAETPQETVKTEMTADMGDELTARMPQTTQQPEKTAETETPEQSGQTGKAAPTETEAPRPLENTNDRQDSERSFESGKDNNREEQKTETRSFEPQQKVDISPERLSTSERFSAVAENPQPNAPVTATTRTLFDTMVQKIQMATVDQTTVMDIQLKPEFLGKVSIQLSMADSGLEIKIKSEDPGVKGLLADQINTLKESLLEKGIKVTEVEVTQTNISDHAYEQNSSNGKGQAAYQSRENSRASLGASIAYGYGSMAAQAGAEVSMLDTGLSSVEYRA